LRPTEAGLESLDQLLTVELQGLTCMNHSDQQFSSASACLGARLQDEYGAKRMELPPLSALFQVAPYGLRRARTHRSWLLSFPLHGRVAAACP
jgi:hypothetical protein